MRQGMPQPTVRLLLDAKMEFLEKIGDGFTAFTAWFEQSLTQVFGSSNERRVRQLGFIRETDGTTKITPGSLIDHINKLEPQVEKLTDEELHNSTVHFRERLKNGE